MKAPARNVRVTAPPPGRGFKLVRPYSTLDAAKAALDNGGRFYHLIARRGDGKLAKSELSKAAGVVLDERKSFVHFDMSLAGLSDGERAEVVAMLGPKVARSYKARGPREVALREAMQVGSNRHFVTVGVPRFARTISVLQTGMILVGKVMIPVQHELPHDLYELREPGSSTSGIPLACWHQKAPLPEVPTRFGGRAAWESVKAGIGQEKKLLFLASFHTPLE